MAGYCTECGRQLDDGAAFCKHCGAAQKDSAGYSVQAPRGAAAYKGPVYAGDGAVRQGIPAPGFSDRASHPEILAAVKKNRKAAGIFALFLAPLPVIGFIIYGIASDRMELGKAAAIGGAVSAVMLLFALIGLIKGRAGNTYEAAVTDKKTRRVYRDRGSGGNGGYTEYVIEAKTVDGGKKRIVEREGSQIIAWNYLQVGDRFRYHPQFNFPYELYDKSKAPYIACVSCLAHNPVEADRCKKCGLPLLK
ncbi:MAG: zinc-ribbon domain-containing protein [Clostridia bacterium]|nr:zinc-ribbon domain-containing protein [Clostridia bacterium]